MGDADLCESWEQFSEDAERLEKELDKLTLDKSKNRMASSRIDPSPEHIRSQASSDVPGTPGSTQQFRILRRNRDPVTVGIPAVNFVSPGIELDSTTEDSLRTQFVPQLKILSRPKPSPAEEVVISTSKEKKQVTTTKSLQQREKEYSEARMRILGDVRFLEEEKEAELECTMTPAEILKMKVARAVLGDNAPPPSAPLPIPVSSGFDNSTSNGPEPPQNATPEGDGILLGGEGGPGVAKSKNKRKPRARSNPNPIVPPPVHFPPSKIDSERITRQPRGPDGTTGFHTPR